MNKFEKMVKTEIGVLIKEGYNIDDILIDLNGLFPNLCYYSDIEELFKNYCIEIMEKYYELKQDGLITESEDLYELTTVVIENIIRDLYNNDNEE